MHAAGAGGGKQVSPWMTRAGQSYTLTAIVSVFVSAEGICPEASSGLQRATTPPPPPSPLLFPLHDRQTGKSSNTEVKMEGGQQE